MASRQPKRETPPATAPVDPVCRQLDTAAAATAVIALPATPRYPAKQAQLAGTVNLMDGDDLIVKGLPQDA